MELILDTADFIVPPTLEDDYLKLMETTFRKLGVEIPYEVDCSYVGDDDMQVLNRDYRGLDRPTDVLSFAFNEGEDPSFALGVENPILGEIIIDHEQALRQAREIGNSDRRELCFLFVHGLLHLLGYDHMVEEEAKRMFALQEEILSEVLQSGN